MPKMKYRNVLESEGKADILFLNNTTRHLQMRRHYSGTHVRCARSFFFILGSRKIRPSTSHLCVDCAKKYIEYIYGKFSREKGERWDMRGAKKFHQSINMYRELRTIKAFEKWLESIALCFVIAWVKVKCDHEIFWFL